MIIEPDVSFHEATVTAFSTDAGALRLSLDGVVKRDTVTSAQILIDGVDEILIDGTPISSVSMDCDDGEVLSLDIGPREMAVIIIWNDFRTGVSRTCSYRVRGRSVEISLGAV